MATGRTNAGAGGGKIVEGTVTGNGTSKLTITGLEFEPKYMVIMGKDASQNVAFYKSGNDYFYYYGTSSTRYYVTGSSLETYSNGTWSTTLYAGSYAFKSGVTYRYLMIG